MNVLVNKISKKNNNTFVIDTNILKKFDRGSYTTVAKILENGYEYNGGDVWEELLQEKGDLTEKGIYFDIITSDKKFNWYIL